MHDYYWQQFTTLLEYKDSLDEFLNTLLFSGNSYNTEEYKKIDDLIWQILDIKDKAEDLKEKIEKEYKDIIRSF